MADPIEALIIEQVTGCTREEAANAYRLIRLSRVDLSDTPLERDLNAVERLRTVDVRRVEASSRAAEYRLREIVDETPWWARGRVRRVLSEALDILRSEIPQVARVGEAIDRIKDAWDGEG